MPRSTAETLRAIEMANWNDLWVRLLLFAEKRIAKMYWRGHLGGPIPGGLESKDVGRSAEKESGTAVRICTVFYVGQFQAN